MGFLRFAGLIVAAGVCTQALAQDQHYANVHGWQIAYNQTETSCSAMNQPNAEGTQLFIAWNYKASSWLVALYNQSWKLKVGQRIPARIIIDRDLLLERRMDVISQHTIVLPISKQADGESAKAFEELSSGDLLQILWSGRTETKVGLQGSRAALAKVAECANKLTEKQPQVAGYRVEVVPREEALVFVSNMFARAGITGFTLMPADPKERYPNVVRYVLPNGSMGSFSAVRGNNTTTADEYTARVLSERTKGCSGQFASTIEKLPSTDGSVLRLVKTACSDGTQSFVTQTTVVRRVNGLLMDLSEASSGPMSPPNSGTSQSAQQAPHQLLDAALHVVK